jgi:hypothetical protein
MIFLFLTQAKEKDRLLVESVQRTRENEIESYHNRKKEMKQFKKKKAGPPTLPLDEHALSLWRRV